MFINKNVLLMTINPQLLGSCIEFKQVRGMVMAADDVLSTDKDLTLDTLADKAQKLGANAVIDIHVKVSRGQMLIYGTAVKLTAKDLGKDAKHE